MDSSVRKNQPLLYSDLFKTHVGNSSSSSSQSSNTSYSGFNTPVLGFSTPSSGLNTPVSGSSDGDFMAELTRQMAECMLQEEENVIKNCDSDVNESESQPAVAKHGRVLRGRRYNGKRLPKADRKYRSGMQAVFLDGSGYGSAGTGVFLPRTAGVPAGRKKKSGCSMVLMPTRVLQVLELHFNRLQDERSRLSDINGEAEVENRTAAEIELPPECDY